MVIMAFSYYVYRRTKRGESSPDFSSSFFLWLWCISIHGCQLWNSTNSNSVDFVYYAEWITRRHCCVLLSLPSCEWHVFGETLPMPQVINCMFPQVKAFLEYSVLCWFLSSPSPQTLKFCITPLRMLDMPSCTIN